MSKSQLVSGLASGAVLHPLCQDWFSRLEADVNGDARLMGEHIGCGG